MVLFLLHSSSKSRIVPQMLRCPAIRNSWLDLTLCFIDFATISSSLTLLITDAPLPIITLFPILTLYFIVEFQTSPAHITNSSTASYNSSCCQSTMSPYIYIMSYIHYLDHCPKWEPIKRKYLKTENRKEKAFIWIFSCFI
jgi:hypothetical protein